MTRPNIVIYSPRPSLGAGLLSRELAAYRVDEEGPRSPHGARLLKRGGHVLINWGSSAPIPTPLSGKAKVVLNESDMVRRAICKYDTCDLLRSLSIPTVEVTRLHAVGMGWLQDGGIVFRRADGLSGGAGIDIYSTKRSGVELPPLEVATQFYARYFPKTHEYRFHVVDGRVIDIQQKRRRSERTENYDPMIRNHAGDWVFCRENVSGTAEELGTMGATCIAAVTAAGLHFGAVDVLAKYRKAGTLQGHVVCEINTAPGLEGTTVTKYSEALKAYAI